MRLPVLRVSLLAVATVLGSTLAACAVDDVPSKDEARAQAAAGKADHLDWCELYDWYGDGECDEFCALPDPDCAPAVPACDDGTLVAGPSTFAPSADGLECELPALHCVTNDGFACPQLSPLPPDFCADGTVVRGAPRFIASADGMECTMPSVHCVTLDASACPQLSPLSPDFCQDGTIVAGEPRFIPSADGKECQMPSVHCLTDDADACPQR